MNEQRIEAYLNLIQQLLDCPSGEENQILNQSIELVDEGFVQVCELLAQQLQEAGEENQAAFLRNVAQQLAAFLNQETPGGGGESRKTQGNATEEDYFNFLIEVLQTTSDSRGNPSVVYPLLQQNLDKLDGNFAQIMQAWATQTLSEVEEDRALSIAADIGNFANLIQQFPLGSRADNLEIGIVGYEISLTVFTPEKRREIWATLQNNLGAAYFSRIRGEQGENLERAIACYQAALQVRTPEAFPHDWAMTQNNLGTAYNQRIRGERGENLERAIACYQAALQVRTPEAFPHDWAMTQNNLGTAYNQRIRGERGENLERAIACYQAALQVYTPEAFPEDWAMTQNNLGNAYRSRIRGERAENLERAIACYEAALQVYTPEAFPQDWAMTQNNLGIAYSDRIRGERGENLERAIACYEEALQVYTPEAFPQDWAMTQNNLGIAYSDRIRGERGENLERAIACYEAALQVRTPEAFPQQWATTQNNLGTAYNNRIRGERGENLERAIACYEAALQVYTPEAFPQQWAMTQNNLGNAYRDRIRGERGENLEMAIACYEAALQVYTPEAFPEDNAQTLFNLGIAYREASQLQKAYDTFAQAINTVEFIRSGIIEGGEADKQKLAEEYNRIYVNMVEICLELENYAAALEYAERSKARNLVELLAATRLKPEGVSPEVWERYQALYQEWWNLQQQRDGSPSSTPGDSSSNADTRSIGVSSSTPATATADISHRLTQLRQDIDTLIETEIAPHDPKFRLGQEVKRIRYAEIQALVDDTTAIVEWYFTNKGIHAFIVTCQGQQPIPVSTPSDAGEALRQLTVEYLTEYYTNDTHWQQQLPAYLQRLAEILELDTLLSHIPPQCQQLVLVPYRFLHLFPLHALPVSETEYLSDRFPQGIRYAPSSQILQLSLSEDNPSLGKGGEEKSLFAIQNPTADLNYTNIEVEAIQTLFHPVTVLKGDAASKTGFNQAATQLKDAAFAHFSCHGSFDFENPQISRLLLADAKLPGIDLSEQVNSLGCLSLPEIFNLRLRQCRLVTLSACETGITDITTTSDEYISILAGFFFAGSRNVLGTLWAVNDLSNAIFMIRFYEILRGETETPVALALKQTQEWMRQVTVADLLEWIEGCRLVGEERKKNMKNKFVWGYKPDYPLYQSPYYWAAFCAVGQ